jgi:hypothetical protein
MGPEELSAWARQNAAPLDLVMETARAGRLPVPNFAAGGVATPADAALLMQLGAESVRRFFLIYSLFFSVFNIFSDFLSFFSVFCLFFTFFQKNSQKINYATNYPLKKLL